MTFKPTPDQALLLFGLLARYGESLQADLVPKVLKADRDQLVKAKLVDVEKVGRGLRLKLSDDGWAWAGDNLSADLPPAQSAMQHFLARLAKHLESTGATLADFIGRAPDGPGIPLASPSPPPKATPRRKREAAPKTRPPAKRKPPTATALRKRIEVAYLALTGGLKDESVRLAHLRRELDDLDRKAVDSGLARILKGDRKASLMRHDDPRQIDKADRDAAFNPAGEPFHLIWIAS